MYDTGSSLATDSKEFELYNFGWEAAVHCTTACELLVDIKMAKIKIEEKQNQNSNKNQTKTD